MPTGFSAVPPPGPAMPVTPMPRSAPKRAAPLGQRRRDLGLTAPCVAEELGRHVAAPSWPRWRTRPPRPARTPRTRGGDEPGRHQPAGARLPHRHPQTPLGQRRGHQAVDGGPGGEQRVGEARAEGSTRYGVDRLGVRAVTGDDLQLAVPEAGGDLEAGELPSTRRSWRPARTPACPTAAASAARRCAPTSAARTARRSPPPATCPAAPTAGRAAPAPAPLRPSRPARRAPAPSRPDPARSHRRAPAPACGCRPPSPPGRGASGRVSGPRASRDPLLQRRVDGRGTPLEVADDGRGQVVGGGSEPAGGDAPGRPPAGDEAQRRAHVLGPVADHHDRAEVDAERPQASESQGPLRSPTSPVSTSVPVTTIPARITRRSAGATGSPRCFLPGLISG